MYVDLWGWFHDSARTARANGDNQRSRYNQLAYQGWSYRRNAQPDEALIVFEEGEALAKRLGDPCWELFFQYWAAEMLFYHKVDKQAALDYAIRVATRAYRDQYLHCAIRSRIYYIVADIYYAIDFFSYQDKISDMLDYLRDEVPMDKDTDLRARHMRAEFEMEFQRWDSAKKFVDEYMPDAEGNDFRLRSGYNILRRIAYAQGYIKLALSYSEETYRYAIKTQSQSVIAAQKLQQAIYHKRLGDDATARAAHLIGLDLYKRYSLPQWSSYYDTVAEYLELNGEIENAHTMRQQQLQDMAEHHSVYSECSAQVDYCRFIGRVGKPIEPALKIAYTLAERLTKPDLYLERLKTIEDGNYHEFDWQATHPAGL